MRQVFDRLETQLRLILREWAITRVPGPELQSAAAANLLLAVAEGRISQFVRSEFRASPTHRFRRAVESAGARSLSLTPRCGASREPLACKNRMARSSSQVACK